MCRSDHSGLEALAPVLLSSRLGLGCGSAALGRLWGWVCKFSQGSLLLNSFQFSRNTWFPGEHHIRISELGWTLTSLTTSSSPHLNRRRGRRSSLSVRRSASAAPGVSMSPHFPQLPLVFTRWNNVGRCPGWGKLLPLYKNSTLLAEAGLWFPEKYVAWSSCLFPF